MRNGMQQRIHWPPPPHFINKLHLKSQDKSVFKFWVNSVQSRVNFLRMLRISPTVNPQRMIKFRRVSCIKSQVKAQVKFESTKISFFFGFSHFIVIVFILVSKLCTRDTGIQSFRIKTLFTAVRKGYSYTGSQLGSRKWTFQGIYQFSPKILTSFKHTHLRRNIYFINKSSELTPIIKRIQHFLALGRHLATTGIP